MRINKHNAGLPASYLFAEIARRVAAYKAAHPEADVISLGIGDVTRPLSPAVLGALHTAVDDMGRAETFHGYGPEQGYAFLREAVAEHDYRSRGVDISPDDIFISDGAKSDLGNFQELFAPDSVIAVADPVYPVYVDSNAMGGRAGQWTGAVWDKVVYLPCTAENGFAPELPLRVPEVIYLCSPNNPTGSTLSREQLAAWVAYAREHQAVILYDSAYEAYISDPDLPHSIYEIEGAREVAVEFRSFSKTAGFTGLRCAYAVIPREVRGTVAEGALYSLRDLWLRRQTTKYNGCPYIVQKAAAAVYTPEGREETRALVRGYMDNATAMRAALALMGLRASGGENAPYIWVGTPRGASSWDFFQLLLEKAHLVCTPGAGFGPSGEGYVRLTSFGDPLRTLEAMDRMRSVL